MKTTTISDWDQVMEMTAVELKKIRFTNENHIALALRNATIETLFPVLGDRTRDMLLRMNASVWAQEIQNETARLEVTFERSWPADWWQHLKQRWFPKWAVRRWPVLMHTERETKAEEHRFTCVAFLLPDFLYEAPPNTGDVCVLKSYISKRPVGGTIGGRP